MFTTSLVSKLFTGATLATGLFAAICLSPQAAEAKTGAPRCQGYSVNKVVKCCEQMITNAKYRKWMTSTGQCSAAAVVCKKVGGGKHDGPGGYEETKPKLLCWLGDNHDYPPPPKRKKRGDDHNYNDRGSPDNGGQDNGGNGNNGDAGGGKP